MQLRAPLLLSALTVASMGCGSTYDIDEVNRVVFKDTGVVAGYDFGVTWDHIKANHDDVFEVRDDDIKQLRRENFLNNAGANGYFVGFGFDKDGGVNSFSVSVNGSNATTLSQAMLLYAQLQSKYEAEYGPGECSGQAEGMSSTTCVWEGDLHVELSRHKLDDSDDGGTSLTLMKPAG